MEQKGNSLAFPLCVQLYLSESILIPILDETSKHVPSHITSISIQHPSASPFPLSSLGLK